MENEDVFDKPQAGKNNAPNISGGKNSTRGRLKSLQEREERESYGTGKSGRDKDGFDQLRKMQAERDRDRRRNKGHKKTAQRMTFGGAPYEPPTRSR